MTPDQARKTLRQLVLQSFSFLETQFIFSLEHRGAGAEYLLRYHSARVTIDLTFAYPELPLLVITHGEGNDAVWYRFSPSMDAEAKLSHRRYYKLVENGARAEESLKEALVFLRCQTAAVRRACAANDPTGLPLPWSRR